MTTCSAARIEIQRTAVVRQTRSAFEHAMQQRFIDDIERLTGRRVLAFISNQHIGPDVEIEVFVLTPPEAEPDATDPTDT